MVAHSLATEKNQHKDEKELEGPHSTMDSILASYPAAPGPGSILGVLKIFKIFSDLDFK